MLLCKTRKKKDFCFRLMHLFSAEHSEQAYQEDLQDIIWVRHLQTSEVSDIITTMTLSLLH